jgi:hypothetical protein
MVDHRVTMQEFERYAPVSSPYSFPVNFSMRPRSDRYNKFLRFIVHNFHKSHFHTHHQTTTNFSLNRDSPYQFENRPTSQFNFLFTFLLYYIFISRCLVIPQRAFMEVANKTAVFVIILGLVQLAIHLGEIQVKSFGLCFLCIVS